MELIEPTLIEKKKRNVTEKYTCLWRYYKNKDL